MGKRESTEESVLYRTPMRIKEILVLPGQMYEFNIQNTYPLCPKCDIPIECDYQKYCGHCGQRLSWVGYKNAKKRYAGKK